MKQGKNIGITLILIITMICFSVPAYADSGENGAKISGSISAYDLIGNPNLFQDEIMTYEEMVEHYAKKTGQSYEQALKKIPDEIKATSMRKDIGYTTKSVILNVASDYKPRIEFYCQIAHGGHFYNILSIYNVELNRKDLYSSKSKQFKGTLKVWLRSTHSIEYSINGDFYNNGTTTFQGGLGVNVGINDLVTVSFNASLATSGNHYKYFYEHLTKYFP